MESPIPWTRTLNFWVSFWTRPQNTLSNMNIIFRMAKFYYFMHMQFKLGLYGENARKQKKSTKYKKTAQKITKLLEVSCYHMWRLGKKFEEVWSKWRRQTYKT
jgi:hypothetical protein